MANEVARWVLSIVTALVAAFVGTTLAVRRTKRERRWQATYDAYQQILSSVEDIRFWAEETYASNMMLPSPGTDALRAASSRFDEAKRRLSGFVHVGELVINGESRAMLEALLHEIASEEFRFEADNDNAAEVDFPSALANHCDLVRKLVNDRLPAILQAARADLE
jgi:hypothetical protein